MTERGKRLTEYWTNLSQDLMTLKDDYRIAENWRMCHANPLNVFREGLKYRTYKIQQNALVYQRMKRFASIMNKLVREPTTCLSQMQDLGGCRAVLPDVRSVSMLFAYYKGDRSLFDSESDVDCDDYVTNPKDDGYRSIHIIGRYETRNTVYRPWNGQWIEIQLRSKLQHAYATAVETVSTFTRTPLKSGYGPSNWKGFFALDGSMFALREDTPKIPETPRTGRELETELRELSKMLNVKSRLRQWTVALQVLPLKKIIGRRWLLLVLNVSENTFRVEAYGHFFEARNEPAALEKQNRSAIDAVLVRLKSLKNLQAACPNYCADTADFLAELNSALD